MFSDVMPLIEITFCSANLFYITFDFSYLLTVLSYLLRYQISISIHQQLQSLGPLIDLILHVSSYSHCFLESIYTHDLLTILFSKCINHKCTLKVSYTERSGITIFNTLSGNFEHVFGLQVILRSCDVR